MSYNNIELWEQLSAVFHYDPITGLIYQNGQTVGWLNEGYVRIGLPNGKHLYAHQIAFLLMEGYIPDQVDHKDLNRSNNAWVNLRAANAHKNRCNVGIKVTNTSGLKGVSWSRSNNCWRMDIQSKGKKYHSYHHTPDEAYAAYVAQSRLLHGEFGNVG